MRKKIGSVVLAVSLLGGLVACSQSSGGTANEKSKKPLDIAVIIKATDSGFWQTVLQGAKAAGKELGSNKVKITTDGPPSETDIDKQVSILENVITRQPDGIVLASTSSDATVPAIENAMSNHIPVVLVDNKVKTDKYVSFLATNNLVGGALAADKLVEQLKKSGKDLKGKVAVVSAMAGVQVLTNRDKGFIDRLKKIAPDIKILDTRFVDNDITKALGTAQDLLTSNPDIVGFFADNNNSGIGVGRAITEEKLQKSVPVVSFDSDEEEINSLKSGAIDCLIVQDPYGMGYQGVMNVVKNIEGKKVPKDVDTGVTAVTMGNFNDDKVQKLLYPEKR